MQWLCLQNNAVFTFLLLSTYWGLVLEAADMSKKEEKMRCVNEKTIKFQK